MSPFNAFLAVALFSAATHHASSSAAPDCRHLPTPTSPSAITNDNRIPAGKLRDGILELQLVLQRATWYPEGEQRCGIDVFAFAEQGKAAQTPGPLIRVRRGTQLRITVRNALAATTVVHGLFDRQTETNTSRQTEIPAGESRTLEFRATVPGTYFYAASGTAFAGQGVPANEYSQATGALIVDSADTGGRDRVFVFTRWRGPQGSVARQQGYELTAFNGRSWPYTERIAAGVGDTLRWRVIAANNDGHVMHLHGFHYTIESFGNNLIDTAYARAQQRVVVTEPMGPGNTMSLRWIPARSGNWIFHCHLKRHMSASQRLDRMPGAAATQPQSAELTSHATQEMAGLVLGITVTPTRETAVSRSGAPRLNLRLFANQHDRVFGDRPGYSFVLQEGDRAPTADSARIPGSMLLLTRGELAQITVINRVALPLAVHWHGIELESYFDGVAGWSGATGRIAPAIAPGDSFVVRMAPPRAGTFIYHTHNEHGDELRSGLYGPLIVLEPGERFDPELDRVFVIAEAGPSVTPDSALGAERPPFINGSATPKPIELVAGRTYRFRVIGIPANDFSAVTLKDQTGLASWRPIAQDGANLPESLRQPRPAQLALGAGQTYDYEFRPMTARVFTLSVDPISALSGRPLQTPTSLTITVRQPR